MSVGERVGIRMHFRTHCIASNVSAAVHSLNVPPVGAHHGLVRLVCMVGSGPSPVVIALLAFDSAGVGRADDPPAAGTITNRAVSRISQWRGTRGLISSTRSASLLNIYKKAQL